MAYFFHWPPSEINALTFTQLERWYNAALRINQEQQEAMKHGS